MFQLKSETAKDQATRLVIAYDHNQCQVDTTDENGPAPAGEIVFYLQPLGGAASRRISDLMYETDKKGTSSFNAGTVVMEKVMAATVAVEGVELAGKPVEKLTRAVYDVLPSWVISRVLRKVNEMSGTVEGDEGE